MKRAVIVHGWDGKPQDAWFPWLKSELEARDFSVTVPAMPSPEAPRIETWVPYLAEIVGQPDEETYLIGHSMGCQTIIRYLERLPAETKVGGVVFVAGFFTLTNLESDGEQVIARPWLATPIDFDKVKAHTSKFVAIFSDNDRWVPLANQQVFEDKLDAQTFVFENRGHFGSSDGRTDFSELLEQVLKLAK